ncbi:hypothetical protein [Rhizobium cauense]|nr:hypothetical protein [Rhizobium cauense]
MKAVLISTSITVALLAVAAAYVLPTVKSPGSAREMALTDRSGNQEFLK